MVTFSKPSNTVEPQGNGPRELKPIIPIECPKVCKLTKGSVEEWLKFWKNLQAIITRQSITDHQGMIAITKSMLRGDAFTAFKNAKGANRPQSEPAYKKTMVDIHTHMFPL
eukprot:2868651-Ditylum_brightwellii.AAC.1